MSVALLLTPGAGAGRDQPTLMAVDRALAADVTVERVERIDLKGSSEPRLVATVGAAAADLAAQAQLAPERLVLGGRSRGGRMCSLAVAEGLPALGLVLISYPLHPPGRPEALRTAHFPALGLPCLFVSGTRDAFGRPDELEAATAGIPGPVTHVWLERGDHGLRGRDDEVAAAVRDFVLSLAGPDAQGAGGGPRG